MNREYHKWFSAALQRDMELLIFGHSGRAVLFFPTRTARFYDYENWGIIEAMSQQINNGEIQVFCVDSIDAESFYNANIHPQSRISRHLQYEQYLLQEVIPLIYSKNSGNYLETAGCSMGAYHAINLALKYPLLFKKAVGISGRYDLTENPGDFKDLLDGFRDDSVYYNMPRQYIANLDDEVLLNAIRNVEIILAIGENDPFLYSNKDLSQLLWNKAIPNQLYIWASNAHRPHYWRKMVPLYL
ncbi:esterase family protein [Pedobacter hartonius]|uniref:Esterase/lipase superfamily enzyme n=1 Tax=Pedobacter hartonius TaxID=425514 RepID=A0A1H3ZWP2_9SPHI|nr:alpha/beta hydrolase-fold protein [Pedobacter hartonius]SEA28075.1 Esterase/lipase superfamily enzyme [Pedobacter hartonius]